MSEETEVPFGRRAIGAAIVSGASGAGLAFSLARPALRDGLETAQMLTDHMRRASADMARGTARAAVESARPTLGAAVDVKDRLRRRALGNLPPAVGGMLEDWRREFIEGEKAVYFGGLRVAGDLKPAVEMAQQRSWALLQSALGTFSDVVDTGLASMVKVGEGLQKPLAPARPKRASKKGHA
jgi:hypothetical protein